MSLFDKEDLNSNGNDFKVLSARAYRGNLSRHLSTFDAVDREKVDHVPSTAHAQGHTCETREVTENGLAPQDRT